MSENKKGVSPWIITVVMGVVAVLFSVYGVQQQTELQQLREEMGKLKEQLRSTESRLESVTRESSRAKAERDSLAQQLQKMEAPKRK